MPSQWPFIIIAAVLLVGMIILTRCADGHPHNDKEEE